MRIHAQIHIYITDCVVTASPSRGVKYRGEHACMTAHMSKLCKLQVNCGYGMVLLMKSCLAIIGQAKGYANRVYTPIHQRPNREQSLVLKLKLVLCC